MTRRSRRQSRAKRAHDKARQAEQAQQLTHALHLATDRAASYRANVLLLDKQLVSAQQALHDLGQQSAHAIDAARKMSAMVGSACVAFGPPEVRDIRKTAFRHDRFMIEQLSAAKRPAYDPLLPYDHFPVQSAQVLMHLLRLETIRDHISSQVRFHVRLADERVGYAISEAALHHMPTALLAEELAGELARLLAQELGKHMRSAPEIAQRAGRR